MELATDIAEYSCPQCATPVAHAGVEQGASCTNCGWGGQAMVFRPLALLVEGAAEALPEDATCAHHPNKKAVAACSGTGDYICALCSIDIEGSTYSAQYLNTVGRKNVGKAFDRYLDRPDSTVSLFLLLSIFPGLNIYWCMGMPIWVPIGFFKLAKAQRLRREDVIFARIVSGARLVVLGILLALFALVLVAVAVAIVTLIVVGE